MGISCNGSPRVYQIQMSTCFLFDFTSRLLLFWFNFYRRARIVHPKWQKNNVQKNEKQKNKNLSHAQCELQLPLFSPFSFYCFTHKLVKNSSNKKRVLFERATRYCWQNFQVKWTKKKIEKNKKKKTVELFFCCRFSRLW